MKDVFYQLSEISIDKRMVGQDIFFDLFKRETLVGFTVKYS
jgi:hypothetical protein